MRIQLTLTIDRLASRSRRLNESRDAHNEHGRAVRREPPLFKVQGGYLGPKGPGPVPAPPVGGTSLMKPRGPSMRALGEP